SGTRPPCARTSTAATNGRAPSAEPSSTPAATVDPGEARPPGRPRLPDAERRLRIRLPGRPTTTRHDNATAPARRVFRPAGVRRVPHAPAQPGSRGRARAGRCALRRHGGHTRLEEAAPGGPLADALTVQVRGDAAQVERPARAGDQAQ